MVANPRNKRVMMAGEIPTASTTNGTQKPDPTILTTQNLRREIEGLRELQEALVSGEIGKLETRLNGMDKAIELLHTASARIPLHVKEEVTHLSELVVEKIERLGDVATERFAGIEKQFAERDKRTEQLSLADKTAVNAALAAQEKQAIAQQEGNNAATSKMEANFTKLIEQGQTLLQEVRRNTDVQINDLKSRLDKGEGKNSVADPMLTATLAQLGDAISGLKSSNDQNIGHSKGTSDNWGAILGAASLAVAVITIVAGVIGFTTMGKSSSVPIVIERSAGGDKVLQ